MRLYTLYRMSSFARNLLRFSPVAESSSDRLKMADPDFVPPLHKKKGDLLYDVDENRRRRGVKYQLLKLKQKSDSSGSEGFDEETIANETVVHNETSYTMPHKQCLTHR